MQVQGQTREYELAIPRSYDRNRAYPVVFGFHGIQGGYGSFIYLSVDQEQAIFVHPKALQTSSGRPWTGSALAGNLDFFDAILADLNSTHCVALNRVFVSGFSAGGLFTAELGCRRGAEVRAIAPLGVPLFDGGSWTGCSGRVAAWVHVGLDDSQLATTRALRSALVTANSCGSSTTPSTPSQCVQYQSCAAGYPVVHCESPGVGHTVPSFAGSTAWSFFSQFP